MKNKLYKVKRKHVDWKSVMDEQGDLRVSARYWKLKTKHPKMSDNRCAFYALKCYYSTTALQRYRISGDLNELLPSSSRCGLWFESVD